MFDYKISKHPHFDEACRAFALRHNMAKLAERAGMNVQTLRNKLNPDQPHQLNAPEIWLLTDLTEDSTLIDGFLAQIHCLPCVPINEVAKEKLPHYVMSATAEIGRVAAGAVSGDVKTSAGRRDAISSINSVTRLMALAAVSLQARLQANPAILLSELTTRKRRKSKCMRQKVKWFISFVTEGRVIQYLKMICSVAIRHCRAMAVTFSR